jgi:hypothetical protein
MIPGVLFCRSYTMRLFIPVPFSDNSYFIRQIITPFEQYCGKGSSNELEAYYEQRKQSKNAETHHDDLLKKEFKKHSIKLSA